MPTHLPLLVVSIHPILRLFTARAVGYVEAVTEHSTLGIHLLILQL